MKEEINMANLFQLREDVAKEVFGDDPDTLREIQRLEEMIRKDPSIVDAPKEPFDYPVMEAEEEEALHRILHEMYGDGY